MTNSEQDNSAVLAPLPAGPEADASQDSEAGSPGESHAPVSTVFSFGETVGLKGDPGFKGYYQGLLEPRAGEQGQCALITVVDPGGEPVKKGSNKPFAADRLVKWQKRKEGR